MVAKGVISLLTLWLMLSHTYGDSESSDEPCCACTNNPTSSPITLQPTTLQPTTLQPTTLQPTTSVPTTSVPTTFVPTTSIPTNVPSANPNPLMCNWIVEDPCNSGDYYTIMIEGNTTKKYCIKFGTEIDAFLFAKTGDSNSLRFMLVADHTQEFTLISANYFFVGRDEADSAWFIVTNEGSTSTQFTFTCYNNVKCTND